MCLQATTCLSNEQRPSCHKRRTFLCTILTSSHRSNFCISKILQDKSPSGPSLKQGRYLNIILFVFGILAFLFVFVCGLMSFSCIHMETLVLKFFFRKHYNSGLKEVVTPSN